MTLLRLLVLLLLAGLATAAALAMIFHQEVALSVINPDRTYEAYTPPPAPDYRSDSSWFRRGTGEGPASVFVIHSNVYRGDGNWNAPYDRETQNAFIANVQLAADAQPFEVWGPVWAPRYRQPTLFARFTQKHPGAAARATAFADIDAAFVQFLREADPAKPLIIAGYDDGALFAGRLWEERIGPNEVLRNQVAALYAIGMPLPARMFEEATCRGETEPRCLVAFTPIDVRFTDYQERLRETTLTLAPDKGYISTSAVGELCAPPPIPGTVSAYDGETGAFVPFDHNGRCERGLFVHATPDKSIRRGPYFGEPWYPNGVNLFASALTEDAGRRIQGVLTILAKEANTAPPLAAPEEIEPSEINTIPGDG